MIPFDFEYYRPESAEEAARLFQRLDREEKQPSYFSGGTEHITLGRLDLMHTKAVIDIKEIPECRAMQYEQNHLVLGAALTLTEVAESGVFPLLGKAAREVADRTARNKITLGGNICGRIFYREAVLPFLLTDSKIMTLGGDGMNVYPIHEVFNKELQLKKGELLVFLLTEKRYINLPYASIKVRQQWETGYPLVTASAIRVDDRVRVAFSGVSPFPFRSKQVEAALNDPNMPVEDRVQQAIRHLPEPVLDDTEGSAEYRKFVIKHTLFDIFSILKGDEYDKWEKN
ncbi:MULTISPECIES: FAD binding domain-containing protein [Bacillus]|uniref:Xanthine dehydrogenase n=1 Tax=Bacillus glycinifermentans TaxID=1664069 RepID=A0AAJ3Z190_9BACI|nr:MULTISPECIES: FAD binding domain-containing protein [Bacillus]KKB74359.1 xanthine dehydrogenase [Bacillus sp. TH008]MDU0073241.1 FAD binding domain-containing protein [Bacillus sp. IG6]MED8021212.1 FAD binding domain-containing protein [Bacillus glycinifermentans]QAT66798.1 xanthine dehydrogenase [Bacillus glycinifermentans]WKB76551.1 FAD binding domain-containing protein [Bacillus glycinifermentans]